MKPIYLNAGPHKSPDEGGCVMEWVSLLAKQPWTDRPTCTNEVITRAAQVVNDRLNDADRQRLLTLIPRIMRARRTDADRRVNVRLAVWAARSVLHLVREQDRAACETAILAAERWLAGEATERECQHAAAVAYAAYAYAAYAYAAYAYDAAAAAAYAATAVAYAADAYAYAAYADADAAYDAAAAAAYAATATAAAAAADMVAWLDELLDVWEKAVNEEGEALWVPSEWEDDALAYLADVRGERR